MSTRQEKRKQNTFKRDQAIRKRYDALSRKKSSRGTPMYKHEYIVEKIANEFFLTDRTVENVLTGSSE